MSWLVCVWHGEERPCDRAGAVLWAWGQAPCVWEGWRGTCPKSLSIPDGIWAPWLYPRLWGGSWQAALPKPGRDAVPAHGGQGEA